VLRGLVHRGGLRADILTGGMIRVGDSIAVLDQRSR
jgi:MOSC domain-containing protein YiiM